MNPACTPARPAEHEREYRVSHKRKSLSACWPEAFSRFGSGGAGRSRTDLHGFAIRCITALLPRRVLTKKGSGCFPFWLEDVGTSSDVWSGKRGSNSRPQPWQGCALPTELFPHLSELRIVCCVRCNKQIIAQIGGLPERVLGNLHQCLVASVLAVDAATDKAAAISSSVKGTGLASRAISST